MTATTEESTLVEEALARTAKPRRRQLDSEGDYTQTLLNSLTLEQIREAVYCLAPTKKIQLRAHADSLDALAMTGESVKTIQQTLLDVERAYPFKHCLLLRLDSLGEAFSIPEVGGVYKSGEFQFTLSHLSEAPILSFTFEHSVEFKEWVDVEKDIRRRRTVVTRHPIIVRVQPDRRLLTLSYPGYTHSKIPGTSGYENVVESLLRIFSRDFGWNLKTLPIKNALKYFLEGTNKRVLQVRADVDTPLARLDVSAKGETNNIEEALASFISAYLPDVDKEALVNASKKAFNSAVPNSIVLYWLQEGLFTRLRFWDIGTELFFVWNKESATYRLVDEITYTLSETSSIQADLGGSSESAISWISRQPPLTLIPPGELAQQLELPPSDARSSLLTAMKAGLVEPVYRVATNELLEDFPNHWSDDLGRFRKVLKTTNGVAIDGTDPGNIEVAFRRVAPLKEGAQ